MTINEAISRIRQSKPNTYSDSELVAWLSELDGTIKTEIIDTHKGENTEFNGYGTDVDTGTVLLVPYPYDKIYIFYLEMKIDYQNGETKRYANSAALYNAAYTEYERYYNRNNMPKGTKFKFF